MCSSDLNCRNISELAQSGAVSIEVGEAISERLEFFKAACIFKVPSAKNVDGKSLCHHAAGSLLVPTETIVLTLSWVCT